MRDATASAMKVSLIGCPFRTIYGEYIEALRGVLARATGEAPKWIASNCGCGDPIAQRREFQTRDCSYFEMPQIHAFQSSTPWRRTLRFGLRNALYYFRASRYRDLSQGSEVVHLQQVFNATGSDVVFHWLRQPSTGAARVVTIHELDREQTDAPERNRTYNCADAIIVHERALGDRLISLGVAPDRIHLVRYGTTVETLPAEGERRGLVFYAGHKPLANKGMTVVLEAMALLERRLGDAAPPLRIHGHYGSVTPAEGEALARTLGVEDRVEWLNQISLPATIDLYRASLALLLPYSGSFAGYPVGVAAANRLPIICTRTAGIPDHLGDEGIWVAEDSSGELADRVVELSENAALCAERGVKLRRRAEQFLSWDVIAHETLGVYRAACEHAVARAEAA